MFSSRPAVETESQNAGHDLLNLLNGVRGAMHASCALALASVLAHHKNGVCCGFADRAQADLLDADIPCIKDVR